MHEYRINDVERLTVKYNFLMKPSTKEKLDQLVKKGKIKSKCDFINFLIERELENYNDYFEKKGV